MRWSMPLILGLAVNTAACDATPETPVAPKPAAAAREPGSQPVAEPSAIDSNRIDSNVEAMPEPTYAKPLDPTPTASTKLLTVEARTPAARDGKITLNVGVPVPGGRVAPTLAVGCALPCWQPIPMWPKDPEDVSIEFSLLRAPGTAGTGAHPIGTFVVESIPAASPGARAEVVVGIGVVAGDLVAHARLRSNGAALQLRKR